MKIDIFEVCAGSVQDCINAELGVIELRRTLHHYLSEKCFA